MGNETHRCNAVLVVAPADPECDDGLGPGQPFGAGLNWGRGLGFGLSTLSSS